MPGQETGDVLLRVCKRRLPLVVWELFTGQLPYQGMLHGEVISKIIVENSRWDQSHVHPG